MYMGLLIFDILLVVAYMAWAVYVTRGIPVSLSATYYALGRWGWVFQAVLFSVGLCLFPLWVGVTDYDWLAFLSCGGVLFVAAAPAFRLELEGVVHYVSAAVCCVCAVAWQVLDGLWDVTLFWALFGGVLALQWREQYMWWIEVAVMGSLFGNLMRII